MENNKNERFLPIGSVVLLKGGTKKAMITGFCSVAAEDKTKMYDYTGCIYPEGYLDFSQICLFDHEQIEQVFHYGYVDEEETEFKKELNEVASQYESGNQEIKSLIEEFNDIEDNDDENDDVTSEGNSAAVIPIMDDISEESSNPNQETEQLEYL